MRALQHGADMRPTSSSAEAWNVIPALLTIEEAAALLRIGRTKAYALAVEWRATGGATGLPVVAFGRALRVPRRRLEELVGTELTALVAPRERRTA